MRMIAVALSLAFTLSLCAQSAEWITLDKGNKEFQKNSISFDGLIKLREKLAKGQKPPVTVLSCSDSRVPPELVFKQNLGEIFLVRSAGNVTDTLGIASLEYALSKPDTKLLVILAHEECGAIEEAMKDTDPSSPNLLALVKHIRLSWVGTRCPEPDKCWTYRTRQNALYTVDDLKKHSEIIRDWIDVKKKPVVVAYYHFDGTLTVWQRINN